jgi:hypothetical protein
MLEMPSQMANISTLIEGKKKSSVVKSRWSNNRMQRSARSESLIVGRLIAARPLIRSVRPSPSK